MNTRKIFLVAALLALFPYRLLAQPESQPSPEVIRYLEVPLTGGIGEEITAPGVRNAINLAKARRATHIVFVMDTPGGRVDDANAIARVLDEQRGDLKYIVVVKRCISAGIWIMSRADEVFFAPEGIAGAAVAYSRSSSTGAAQVDAKLNSALAASLGAAASARGQAPEVYRAMIVMEASLYSCAGPEGSLQLLESQPHSGEFREIDSRSTVLSLTSALAAEIGFGRVLPSGDPRSIAEVRGWTMEPVGPAAVAQVQQGARAIKQRVESKESAIESANAAALRIKELVALAPQIVQKAQAADPGRHTYYVNDRGMFTPQSQIDWRKRTDEAVARWNDVLHLGNDINKEVGRYNRAIDDINTAIQREHEARLYDGKPEPLDMPEPEFRAQLKEMMRTAQEAKSKLLANRGKTRR